MLACSAVDCQGSTEVTHIIMPGKTPFQVGSEAVKDGIKLTRIPLVTSPVLISIAIPTTCAETTYAVPTPNRRINPIF